MLRESTTNERLICRSRQYTFAYGQEGKKEEEDPFTELHAGEV